MPSHSEIPIAHSLHYISTKSLSRSSQNHEGPDCHENHDAGTCAEKRLSHTGDTQLRTGSSALGLLAGLQGVQEVAAADRPALVPGLRVGGVRAAAQQAGARPDLINGGLHLERSHSFLQQQRSQCWAQNKAREFQLGSGRHMDQVQGARNL